MHCSGCARLTQAFLCLFAQSAKPNGKRQLKKSPIIELANGSNRQSHYALLQSDVFIKPTGRRKKAKKEAVHCFVGSIIRREY